MGTSVYALEVATLLWSHPLLAGLLLIPFTTPICHIVVFFSPLLISTALCVMALVSIGPEIEAISEERERLFKILGLTFRTSETEGPAPRYRIFRQGRNPRLRVGWPRRFGAGERWTDRVRGIQVHGQSIWLADSHFVGDIAEEGLKADFRDEDGGINMLEEDSSRNGAVALVNDGLSGTLTGVNELILNLSLPFSDLSGYEANTPFSHANTLNERSRDKQGESMPRKQVHEDDAGHAAFLEGLESCSAINDGELVVLRSPLKVSPRIDVSLEAGSSKGNETEHSSNKSSGDNS